MFSSRPRVTMTQIGAQCGVSHATVSLALRNDPRITAKVRDQVQRKALEMGYEPDPVLTVLARYRQRNKNFPVKAAIAWLNAWEDPSELLRHKEFEAYWQGASACATKFGYHLEEFVLTKEMSYARLERILITRNIKGIIIPPHGHEQRRRMDTFNFNHFSAVRMGRSVESPELNVVSSDQTANTALAFRKVREKGYGRIGYVGHHHPQRLFAAGFMHAQLDIPAKERIPLCILSMPFDFEVARKQITKWISVHKPEAIISEAPQLPSILAAAGLRVPQDIALAGMSVVDGNISAGIDQNSYEVGRIAMLMVISLITDFAQGVPTIFHQLLVEGKWVDGPECPDHFPCKT